MLNYRTKRLTHDSTNAWTHLALVTSYLPALLVDNWFKHVLTYMDMRTDDHVDMLLPLKCDVCSNP